MTEFRKQLEQELDHLRGARDELRVRLHLGGAELRDQWEDLERGWQHFEGRLKVLRNESDEVVSEIGETLHILADQLRTGYKRIKKLT
jgi:predicted  nucleic acid-binding Zn-ribbon protein